MRAETMRERPSYELFKQDDIVSFYNFQLPRWLIENSRYMPLSLEAKFTYTLLFNRFQLSKHNGWINELGEVFIIYTRQELSARLNICEKRVSAAMNELKEFMLIWERRCGRGMANQIYLASVKASLEDAVKSQGGPLDPRTAETEVLENENTQEPRYRSFKKLQNGGSKSAEATVQEPPNQRPSNTDLRFNDLSINSQGQPESGQTDALESVIEQAELDILDEDEATVMRDAIERLFYTQSLKIGNAVYPNERIRSNLSRLDGFIVQDAVSKITRNTTVKVRNSSAYVVAVLFNTIMESGSDLIVDPYLNHLRARSVKAGSARDGG